jgi:transcriptional regulator with XRE-family HTH domain
VTYFKVNLTYNEGVNNLAIEIGKRLRAARKKVGMTQEEMGAALGMTRTGYTNLETGRSLLTLDNLLKLPKILHQPAIYFLGMDGELSEDEAELLELYRSLPEDHKKANLDGLRGIAAGFRKKE